MEIGTTGGEIEYVASNRGIDPRGIRSAELGTRLDASLLRGRLPVWVQLVVLGPPNAEQALPPFTVTVAGMPASPHQIAALTPRQRVLDEQIVSGGPQATAQAGFSPAVAGEKAR